MNISHIIFTLLLAASQVLKADIVAQWTFDSQPPDANTTTGTTLPSTGSGSAFPFGGVTTSFATGSGAVPADDSGWNTTSYPPGTNYNKTAGVQFHIDTTGFTNLSLSWAERHSASASRYLRFRYSLNGYSFYDADVLPLTQDSVFVQRTLSLSGLPGAANNPFFAFQFVTEFERTATGAGTNGYIPTKTGANYSSSGTIRYDMVTVTGTLLPGVNTPPNVSDIPNLVLRVGQTAAPVAFTVWDFEDPGSGLAVTGFSSDPGTVPTLLFTGDTGHRWLTLTAGDQPGSAMVTVQVYDSGGKWTSTTFNVTVLPLNTAPMLTLAVAHTNTVAGAPACPVAVLVSDLETPPESLNVYAVSTNSDLVPNANILFSGVGSNRSMTVTPAPGQSGLAPISVIASDGINETIAPFSLMIAPSPDVLLFDPFTYADGSLITNSAFYWATRSGIPGQCQVTGGELEISGDQTEDVLAPLAGGSFDPGKSTVLFASFHLTALGLPRLIPGYFAHFVGSSLRGRVFVGATNAAPGHYRLSVANATGDPVQLAFDLKTNQTSLVVMRYDVDTAATTLWVDPLAKTDPAAHATDLQTATRITGFALRQDSSLGTILRVDNLRVGRTFASVVPGAMQEPPRLRHHVEGGNLMLAWDGSEWVLESASKIEGSFRPVSGATSPYPVSLSGAGQFFRLVNP